MTDRQPIKPQKARNPSRDFDTWCWNIPNCFREFSSHTYNLDRKWHHKTCYIMMTKYQYSHYTHGPPELVYIHEYTETRSMDTRWRDSEVIPISLGTGWPWPLAPRPRALWLLCNKLESMADSLLRWDARSCEGRPLARKFCLTEPGRPGSRTWPWPWPWPSPGVVCSCISRVSWWRYSLSDSMVGWKLWLWAGFPRPPTYFVRCWNN